MSTWDPSTPQVVELPSGRLIRGRGLREEVSPALIPDFGLYLQAKFPEEVTWPNRWVRWRNFWLPADREDAQDAFQETWRRAALDRVEVACSGGRGRTGTALACLAILDGMSPQQAVDFVRENYNSKAIETPWQRRFVMQFGC
jgi:hypothetical protein